MVICSKKKEKEKENMFPSSLAKHLKPDVEYI